MERFEPAIRADLQEVYGVDLAELWKSRRWKHLLSLIDGLRANSRYIEAMHNDDEFMEMVRNQQGDGPFDAAPPLGTWTPEVDMMANVLDAVNNLTAVTVAVNNGKVKKPKPVRRPLTDKSKPSTLTEDQETLFDLFGSVPSKEQ